MASRQLHTVLRQLRRLTSPERGAGLTDAELLERWVGRRDEAAFEVLVWRHGPAVLNLCRCLLRHEHDAEDAFQAAFLALARQAGAIGKRAALGSWLYKVAYRVTLKVKAGAARRAAHERRAATAGEAAASPEPVGDNLRPVLTEEVSRLPERYRAPVVLCYLEGKTNAEAAAQLGCPKGTVLSRLAWARQRLRSRLARRGVALSAGSLAAALAPDPAAAAVPAALAGAAVNVARLTAAGAAPAAGALPARVVALTDEALRAAWPVRFKAVAALVLALGALAAGAGLASHQARKAPSPQEEPPAAQAADQPKPAEEKRPRLDAAGDPLPEGALARLGTARFRHGGVVWAVAFSPDGKRVASRGGDQAVRVWDAATGKELHQLAVPHDDLRSVAFSADGKAVASGGAGGAVRFWDVATGKELRKLGKVVGPRLTVRGQSTLLLKPPPDFALSPDGKLLATGGVDGEVALWDDASGKELWRSDLAKGLHGGSADSGARGGRLELAPTVAFAFSADGKTLAAAETGSAVPGGPVRLWDAATGKEVVSFSDGERSFASLAFSPDGKVLAAGTKDGVVYRWDLAAKKELDRLQGHGREVTGVAFSPDGKVLASAGFDKTVRLWDPAAGKELRQLQGHVDTVECLAFAPDGKTLASGGADNCVRLWDVATGKEIRPPGEPPCLVSPVALTPDGKLVAAGADDHSVRLWDVAAGKEVRALRGHKERVEAVAFAPDGQTLASGGADDTVFLWDVATGKELRRLPGLPPRVEALAFAPGGKLLAVGGAFHTILLCDPATGKEVRQLDAGDPGVGSSGDGRTYHLSTRARPALAFTPDGKYLAAGGSIPDGRQAVVRVWDVATGQELHKLAGHDSPVSWVTFSPDGRTLASCDDKTVRLWDVAAGKERGRLGEGKGPYSCLGFSPDGKALVGGGDKALRFWDPFTGVERGSLAGHGGWVRSLAFTPDGKTLISGSADTTAMAWDAAGLKKGGGPAQAELSAKELTALWQDLTGDDAAKAYRAVGRFAAAPGQAVPFLKERLRPVSSEVAPAVKQLLTDLESEQFAVRQQAAEGLEKLGEEAEVALRRALKESSSLEVRRRVEGLLEKLPPPARRPGPRALEVLEYAGTPEARQALQALAKGAPEAPLTQEAKAALERLARRPANAP